MITKNYSLDTITISEWYNEIRKNAHQYRVKYERCFTSNTPVSKMQFFRKASDTYMNLNELLSHIINYNDVINEDKCLSCKHDNVHVRKLQRNFERWYPWIIRCRDGNQFKKVVDYDLKDFR